MAELGSGNGTDYPAALDTDNTLEVDGSTLARADVPNDMGAAIVAIENELGTNPAGTLADVKTFLQTEHNTNGTHDSAKVVMIAGSQTITGEKLFSETIRFTKGTDVASATTLTLGAGNYFDITGTTTITGITSIGAGTWVRLHFDGACQLTHHATDFVIIGGASITTEAGDEVEFVEYATGKWRMTTYSRGIDYIDGTIKTAHIANDNVTMAKLAVSTGSGNYALGTGGTQVAPQGYFYWYWTGAGDVSLQVYVNSDWRDIAGPAADAGGYPFYSNGVNVRWLNASA